MSEMVERVAKSIYESRLLVKPREPWAGGKASVTEIFCMEAARAAIKAMREPTAKMNRDGAMCLPDYDPLDDDAMGCWQRMIDAALASET